MTHPSITGFADAVRRRGAPIVIRRLSPLPGPVPAISPPTLSADLVVDGAVAPGATSISLRCSSAIGRLVAGDVLTIADQSLTVSTDTLARSQAGQNGFSAVPVTPVQAPIADGAAVSIAFAADLNTFAMINSFPRRLIDGERIKARDLSVVMGGLNLLAVEPTWRLLFGGRVLSIVDAQPTYLRTEIARWDVQAR